MTTRTHPASLGASASGGRWLNILLGVWLFISTYAWRHSDASTTNAAFVGMGIAVFAVGALFVDWLRYVNTALATWLFVSTMVIAHATSVTRGHNAIVALLVFVASLAPGSRRSGARPGEQT